MATREGAIADNGLMTSPGPTEATKGRFVTQNGYGALLDQAVEGDKFVLRARDSGVGGVVYIVWVSENVESDPLESYVGPLVDRAVVRILPRRGALPILADNGTILLV